MTTRERVARMFEHREADRVPITDSPWQGTINRWIVEGMPADADWRDYFGADKFEGFSADVSPRFPERVIEENDKFFVSESSFGVTMKYLKGEDTTPEFLDYKINSRGAWESAKKRMTPEPGRVDIKHLEKYYPLWRSEGRWIQIGLQFGYDMTHSWIVGMETVLVAMLEEPDWMTDMFHTLLDFNIELLDTLWDRGYRFDGMSFCDDMGYKNHQFFSIEMYRELLKPAHKRAFAWAKEHGMYTQLHSCGYIEPFIPDLIEIGMDALNPIEVKAGMDPIKLKSKFGDKLLLHGGVNAVLWDKRDEIIAEIDRVVPALKENGGYIFSSDHSIPNTVSLQNFADIVARVKKVGAY